MVKLLRNHIPTSGADAWQPLYTTMRRRKVRSNGWEAFDELRVVMGHLHASIGLPACSQGPISSLNSIVMCDALGSNNFRPPREEGACWLLSGYIARTCHGGMALFLAR